MLIEKDVRIARGNCINNTKYECDMCRKVLKLEERYGVGMTELGRGTYKKKWDLCAKCMKTLEHNVDIWYSRLKSKNS